MAAAPKSRSAPVKLLLRLLLGLLHLLGHGCHPDLVLRAVGSAGRLAPFGSSLTVNTPCHGRAASASEKWKKVLYFRSLTDIQIGINGRSDC
jgi:hypothetical protein